MKKLKQESRYISYQQRIMIYDLLKDDQQLRLALKILYKTAIRINEFSLIFDFNDNDTHIVIKPQKDNNSRTIKICDEMRTYKLKGYITNGETIRKQIQRFSNKYKIELSPHDMRASAITDLVNNDKPIQDIQVFTGHKDLKQILIYCKKLKDVSYLYDFLDNPLLYDKNKLYFDELVECRKQKDELLKRNELMAAELKKLKGEI